MAMFHSKLVVETVQNTYLLQKKRQGTPEEKDPDMVDSLLKRLRKNGKDIFDDSERLVPTPDEQIKHFEATNN